MWGLSCSPIQWLHPSNFNFDSDVDFVSSWYTLKHMLCFFRYTIFNIEEPCYGWKHSSFAVYEVSLWGKMPELEKLSTLRWPAITLHSFIHQSIDRILYLTATRCRRQYSFSLAFPGSGAHVFWGRGYPRESSGDDLRKVDTNQYKHICCSGKYLFYGGVGCKLCLV